MNWTALMKVDSVLSWLACEVWLLSERTGIPLGPLAPHVFGLMLGTPHFGQKEER